MWRNSHTHTLRVVRSGHPLARTTHTELYVALIRWHTHTPHQFYTIGTPLEYHLHTMLTSLLHNFTLHLQQLYTNGVNNTPISTTFTQLVLQLYTIVTLLYINCCTTCEHHTPHLQH
jgi:hypothetical protein